MRDLYIGLISGTSLDGVDAVLIEFHDEAAPQILARHLAPYPSNVLDSIQELCREPRVDMDTYGQTDRILGDLFASAAMETIEQAQLAPTAIRAIGTHGQTIRHHPEGNTPFTLQIGDPNRIAEATGITTVGDFRRRDIAAGGEGAPLVPAFHQAVFHSAAENRVILNLGGISNITNLPKDRTKPVTGFDCGPGNTLLDAVYQKHFNSAYDEGGRIAASGKIMSTLLESMLSDRYFELAPPKSTGPEHFSMDWLQGFLNGETTQPTTPDLLATLCELTARCISDSVEKLSALPNRLLICGGGAHNDFLVQRIAEHVKCPVESTEAYGIAADWVEAAAFAWLARETLAGRPGNIPEVTGASKAVVLGAIYPG